MQNTIHVCKNHERTIEVVKWVDNVIPVHAKKNVKCNQKTIAYSKDYEIHYLTIGECVIDAFGSNEEVIKELFQVKYNETLIPLRTYHSPELWNGEDHILELVYLGSYGNHWDYYRHTKIKNVGNIFLTEYKSEIAKEYNHKGHDLIRENLDYLKKNEFVSKRVTEYECTTADVNKLLNKIKTKL